MYKIIIEKCSSVIKFGCGKQENTDLCTMQRHSECTRTLSLSVDRQLSSFHPSCIARNVFSSLSLLFCSQNARVHSLDCSLNQVKLLFASTFDC